MEQNVNNYFLLLNQIQNFNTKMKTLILIPLIQNCKNVKHISLQKIYFLWHYVIFETV